MEFFITVGFDSSILLNRNKFFTHLISPFILPHHLKHLDRILGLPFRKSWLRHCPQPQSFSCYLSISHTTSQILNLFLISGGGMIFMFKTIRKYCVFLLCNKNISKNFIVRPGLNKSQEKKSEQVKTQVSSSLDLHLTYDFYTSLCDSDIYHQKFFGN
ncbi:hypothetical protein BpHYR1_044806 [Brachionus plicatilis]|uniref:Uncharacterized protein n=1 Tax=Brachionus plicatilis TaxID=10195 RepID=A0A3M7QH78_BRAPC|nr:hypothetical protein BpHYR1_044806 [Brachionus plicatilis]